MEAVRTVELFGKNIPVRKYGCKNYQMKEPLYITVPRVNIFIQTTNLCNANCDFCIYHSHENKFFDILKLKSIIKELSNRKDLDIGKLNFTGGEPSLVCVGLSEIIEACRDNLDLERKPEVTLNTNGYDLSYILKYEDFFDSVGLSRHHYIDELNYELFYSKNVASSNDIKNLMSSIKKKEIIQLRCNLIKGSIDSYEKMTKYLNHAINLDVSDCGFVTLAPNNLFCKTHQIDFSSLVNISKDLIKTNDWNRVEDDDFSKVYCKCANYLYSNESGKICKFYARLFCNNSNNDGILVYDGEFLRHGFGGEIII